MGDVNGSNGAPKGGRRGKCKWFNVAKGWGFITPNDGGPDVFVHQSVIQMPGFRSLGDEEDVEFECKTSDKGLEATAVTGLEGENCKGSHRRPMSKKRFKKIRCYNCGEFANHIAAKCTMGPQPKRCHHCKSVDHLIADCPAREERKNGKSNPGSEPKCNNNNNDLDTTTTTTAIRDIDSRHHHNHNHHHHHHLGNGDSNYKNNHEEEDDEDEELHDHRINCSSSPSSSCGTPSSLGKREL